MRTELVELLHARHSPHREGTREGEILLGHKDRGRHYVPLRLNRGDGAE